jgi:hypothetical protein
MPKTIKDQKMTTEEDWISTLKSKFNLMTQCFKINMLISSLVAALYSFKKRMELK